jgi:hypothetical protein
VSGAAALGHQATGSIACGGQECGLAVSYDGPPSLALVQNSAMNDEPAVSIRFLIDPGVAGNPRFRMACGGSIRILLLFQDFTPGTGIKVVLFLKQNSESSGAWRLAAYVREDTGPFVFGGEGYLTGLTPVSSTLVELEWGAATAPGANNGFFRAFRTLDQPGASRIPIFTRNDLDNDTQRLNVMQAGSVSTEELTNPGGSCPNAGQPTEGTLYLDEFRIDPL